MRRILKSALLASCLCLIAGMLFASENSKVIAFDGVKNLPAPDPYNYPNRCVPRSACRILFYWYSSWGFDAYNVDGQSLIEFLYSPMARIGGVPGSSVEEKIKNAIRSVVDVYYPIHRFSVDVQPGSKDDPLPAFQKIVSEVEANRPVLWSVKFHSGIKSGHAHAMTVVGYKWTQGDISTAKVKVIQPDLVGNTISDWIDFIGATWAAQVYDDEIGEYVTPALSDYRLNVYYIMPPGVQVQLSNQFIDQGNAMNCGSVCVNGAYHALPYTFSQTVAVPCTIVFDDWYLWPETDVLHFFTSCSDHAERSRVITPHWGESFVSNAYYKKRPSLSGNYGGLICHLSWDWPPSSRPPFFTEFKLYKQGVPEPIYAGTGNSFDDYVGEIYEGYAGIYTLHAMVYGAGEGGYMSSNQCKVSVVVGGSIDPSSPHQGGNGAAAASEPARFELLPVRPNPSSGPFIITYQLTGSARTSLVVYNRLGQIVRTLVNEVQQAGAHQQVWDGKDANGRQVSTGIYFSRLITGNKGDTKKIVVVR